MIVGKNSVACNGCGLTLWNYDDYKSATKLRAEYSTRGWRLIVGDGYLYGDYCPDCIKEKKHKKPRLTSLNL